MSARAFLVTVAVLVLVGIAVWGSSWSDGGTPPPTEAVAPTPQGSRAPRAVSASRVGGAQGTPAAPAGRLYRPPLRTDRVSVVGAEAQGRVQGITPEEAAKFEAMERTPSPVARQAGEEEKERRREESRQRREMRKRGIDPGPRDRSDSGPGQRVDEVQAVLDEAADEAEQAATEGVKR